MSFIPSSSELAESLAFSSMSYVFFVDGQKVSQKEIDQTLGSQMGLFKDGQWGESVGFLSEGITFTFLRADKI